MSCDLLYILKSLFTIIEMRLFFPRSREFVVFLLPRYKTASEFQSLCCSVQIYFDIINDYTHDMKMWKIAFAKHFPYLLYF